MKAKNIYLVIAKEVSTDNNDNMNSIIKIIDNFNTVIDKKEYEKKTQENADSVFAIPVEYSIASSWRLEDKVSKKTGVKVEFKTLDPNKKELGGITVDYEVPEAIKKFTINVNIRSLPATIEGEYSVVAKLLSGKGEEIAKSEYSYEVNFKWQSKEKIA